VRSSTRLDPIGGSDSQRRGSISMSTWKEKRSGRNEGRNTRVRISYQRQRVVIDTIETDLSIYCFREALRERRETRHD
jgi:hypothetical protein